MFSNSDNALLFIISKHIYLQFLYLQKVDNKRAKTDTMTVTFLCTGEIEIAQASFQVVDRAVWSLTGVSLDPGAAQTLRHHHGVPNLHSPTQIATPNSTRQVNII